MGRWGRPRGQGYAAWEERPTLVGAESPVGIGSKVRVSSTEASRLPPPLPPYTTRYLTHRDKCPEPLCFLLTTGLLPWSPQVAPRLNSR